MESFRDVDALVHISQFVSHLAETRAKILDWRKALMMLKKIPVTLDKNISLKYTVQTQAQHVWKPNYILFPW